MNGRAIFLHDAPLEDVQARFARALADDGVRNDRTEVVPVTEALGRVSAEAVRARLSSPHYHACAMDGIAVQSARTAGARETQPLDLVLGDDAHLVDTGDPLPPGCDAVIMIEQVQIDGNRAAIRAAVAPWEHVRPIGEDIVATETVVPRKRTLGIADCAALAAAGVSDVRVIRRPRVAILTTGSELVDVTTPAPPRGAILDSNAVLLAAAVRAAGAQPVPLGRFRDDPSEIGAAVEHGIEDCDVVVVNAGSSAGAEDYTAGVFAMHGRVLIHGVAIRPGHPLVLGIARASDGRAVPLFGIPGYPVSAALCADLFLRPLLLRLGGLDPDDPQWIDVVLARKLYSPLGEDEFVRAVAARIGERLVATPLRRGAGVITSLSRANCLVVVPRHTEGMHAGATVRARALRPTSVFERTLLAVGSHDVALDAVAGALADDDVELVSANVGSIAGLVALRDGASHCAGTHVLDPATGTYNDAAIARFGPPEPVAIVHLARRQQGLIVARGNPLGISGLADIAARGLRFVNRQKDAGTRMLFDALLAEAGIPTGAIVGYDRIEFTHTAVAALVADGSADVGLGILAAARALELDFIPLAAEPYELVMLAAALASDPRLQALVARLRTADVHAEIAALGGYDTRETGTVRELRTTVG